MQFFGETHLNFVGTRRTAFVVSAVLLIAGLVSLAIKGGPDLSIDFEGGTLIQVRFDQPVEIGRLRAVIEESGYGGGQIQSFGEPNEYLIKVEKVDEPDIASTRLLGALERVAPGLGWRAVSVKELPPDYAHDFEGGNLVVLEADSIPPIDTLETRLREAGVSIVKATMETSDRLAVNLPYQGVEAKAAEKLKTELIEAFPDRRVEIRRTETVGPRIGEELKNRAWAAIVISIFGILIYISWRFEFKFAVGAIIALIHDVVITVGIFSILNKEISLAIIAALLTEATEG